jgi:hypothetical protein
MRVYVSGRWDIDISKDTRQYIAALIEHISSLSMSDADRFLLSLQDLSVGPLRVGPMGTCKEDELTRVLEDVFGQSGYTVVPVRNATD